MFPSLLALCRCMHFASREHFVLLSILQDKMDAVERLRRVEAFNREKQLQNIEADNQRIAEMNLRKYKLQQEKIQMRKEQVSACCPSVGAKIEFEAHLQHRSLATGG